jgi:ribosomal protein S6--L-glutamate ligase
VNREAKTLTRIAFSRRFRSCPGLTILQPRPNFQDYPPAEQELIRRADKVYYPTALLADLFLTLGKETFPSRETYVYSGDKVKQTALFQVLDIPHPRTKCYYGRQRETIRLDFSLPLVAKVARGSSLGEGVHLITSDGELQEYLKRNRLAYIQEYLPLERDLRVILINHRVILSYWKKGPPGEFRHNLARGGALDFDNIPPEALALARRVTRACNFDDVGLDLCHTPSRGWLVLEANMNYGREGLARRGMKLEEVLRDLKEEGVI